MTTPSLVATAKISEQPGADLQALLTIASAHGRPSLFMLKHGWHMVIDMHVAALGATFEIRSDFGCATPVAAAEQALTRMRQALKTTQGNFNAKDLL